jgi:hypothetical protein
MQSESAHFPATPIALKMAVAIGIGMLVGMEREWSNKDVGIRTFALVARNGEALSDQGSEHAETTKDKTVTKTLTIKMATVVATGIAARSQSTGSSSSPNCCCENRPALRASELLFSIPRTNYFFLPQNSAILYPG